MSDTESSGMDKLRNNTIRNYAIFGANGGVGSEMSRRLVGEGHRVTLLGRNEMELRRLSDEVDAQLEIVDASSIAETEECLARVAESNGPLDGVVNCVGSLLLKPAHLTSPDEWAATIAANLTSAFAVVRAAVPVMRKDGGSIVLISSAAARTGLPNHEAIAAAKAGVIGLTQSAAATYAGRNIRVNAIAPGLIQTPLTKRIWASEKAAAASRAMHPLKRLGTPADVASLIAWLLDEENGWITGQIFGVDGGLGTVRANGR